MKPKTKLQKLVFGLSQQLPEVTNEQFNWGTSACFEGNFVRSRNTLFCLDCGHDWKNKEVLTETTCPSCNLELKKIKHYKKIATSHEYWSILTTVEDVQVVRMIFTSKFMKKNKPASYHSTEVMQHFIFSDGKIMTTSKSVMGLSGYVDNWILSSDLEVRRDGYGFYQRANITPFKIYPKRKILPIIKRNGFKGHFYSNNPQRVFSSLLSSSKAETLIKSGQTELLKQVLTDGDKSRQLNKWWSSIRVCIRKGYKVPDATIWFDYLDLLERFGKDTLNSFYACPLNLKKEHDKLVEKQRRIDQKREELELREQLEEEQPKFVEAKNKFFDLHIKAGDLEIIPLKSVEEFMIEGDKLKHCVFVSKYYEKPQSLVLSARLNKEPVETIEVNLVTMSVTQARGIGNKATIHHDFIIDAIRQNMNQIASRLNR